MNERLITPQRLDEDEENLSKALRPQSLESFIGQAKVKDNLSVFIQAAAARKEALDHVLLAGPPGLGKTTLAKIIANELGVGFRATSGPIISKAGDLAALLTNLQPHDVLFIDEIHRLNSTIEEVLYPAMEDGQLDIMIGEGPAARSIQINLPPFTLIGATTRAGLISQPLRERFGIPVSMIFYTPEDLQKIITRNAALLNMPLGEDGALEIARRCRGTPRIAGRLLRRVRDIAHVAGVSQINQEVADKALSRLEVDNRGFDAMDRRYLSCIVENYGGGPVGVETIAAAISEQKDVVEEVIEPYLIQQGFVQRTPRGRTLTEKAYNYLHLPAPQTKTPDLFTS